MAEVALAPGRWERVAIGRLADQARRAIADAATAPIQLASGGRALIAPFAFGSGAALHLCAPFEPPIWIALSLCLVAAIAGLVLRRRGGFVASLAALVALTAGGAGWTAWRAERVAAPVVSASEAPRRFQGWIERIDARSDDRRRYWIRLTALEGAARAETPVRIRVSALDSGLRPGDGATGLAVLGPPEGPFERGAYDFARSAWFDRLGGTGYAYGRLTSATVDTPKGQALGRAVTRWRAGLTARLVATDSRQGGLIAALTTGDLSHVREDTTQALRATGLYHVVSISGLHMALVGGGVLFALASGLACIEPWARRGDVRKPAAVIAFLTLSAYLVLSGASTPAIRAYLMSAIVLAAIVFDRRAISLRSVATAASLILLVQPESAVEPGFQMSFAATTALVAAHEARRRSATVAVADRGLLAGGRRFLGELSATSLVAGGATAAFAAFHFQTMAAYGFAANLFAMPVFSLIAMPAVVLTALLTPLGLEAAPAFVAAQALNLFEAIARAFGEQPNAVTPIRAGPGLALGLIAAGLLSACILTSGRARVGVPLAIAAGLAWCFWPQPNLWVGPRGELVIKLAGQTGRVIVVGPDRGPNRFAAERFARRRATGPPIPAALADEVSDAVRCDTTGCVYRLGGLVLSQPTGPPDVDDCARADVVILARPPPARLRHRCNARLIEADADTAFTARLSASGSLTLTAAAPARRWTKTQS